MKTTSDIYFAAALMSLGAKLENVDRTDQRHMEFEFSAVESPPAALDGWEKEWANGDLLVNAVQYKDAIQRMKSIVHSR